jgi:hypothetical protein
VAPQRYNIELFHAKLNWAKKNLTKEQVKKLLLVTDIGGRTIFLRQQRALMKRYLREC